MQLHTETVQNTVRESALKVTSPLIKPAAGYSILLYYRVYCYTTILLLIFRPTSTNGLSCSAL